MMLNENLMLISLLLPFSKNCGLIENHPIQFQIPPLVNLAVRQGSRERNARIGIERKVKALLT